jgi:hypothetical protein
MVACWLGTFQKRRLITCDVTIYHAEHDIALLDHHTQTPPKIQNIHSCSCTLPVALQKPRICASVRRSEDIDWMSGLASLPQPLGSARGCAGNFDTDVDLIYKDTMAVIDRK